MIENLAARKIREIDLSAAGRREAQRQGKIACSKKKFMEHDQNIDSQILRDNIKQENDLQEGIYSPQNHQPNAARSTT